MKRDYTDKTDQAPEPSSPKYQDGQQVYMRGEPFFVTGVLSTRSDDGEFLYGLQGKKGDRGSVLRGIYKESSLSLTAQE